VATPSSWPDRCGIMLACAVLWTCGGRSSGIDVPVAADPGAAEVADVPLQDRLVPDQGQDGGGCSHMDCAYYIFHCEGFELTCAECMKIFAPVTGCVDCCGQLPYGGYGAKQWCCPPEDDADARDAPDAAADG
jgi:hypothetical protein